MLVLLSDGPSGKVQAQADLASTGSPRLTSPRAGWVCVALAIGLASELVAAAIFQWSLPLDPLLPLLDPNAQLAQVLRPAVSVGPVILIIHFLLNQAAKFFGTK